jgi:hypothetical protein
MKRVFLWNFLDGATATCTSGTCVFCVLFTVLSLVGGVTSSMIPLERVLHAGEELFHAGEDLLHFGDDDVVVVCSSFFLLGFNLFLIWLLRVGDGVVGFLQMISNWLLSSPTGNYSITSSIVLLS